MNIIRKHQLIMAAAFIVLGFVLMQVPFTALVGAKARFTMFDFFGPIVGGLLGSLPGAALVFVMQLANWAMHGFQTDAATIIRFFPMLIAVLYFARKSIWQIALPAVCILAFLAHPEGRRAAVFTVYWLIPIAMYFWRDRLVFARALGATFAAHAVGGALWIWTFNMPAGIWLSLITVVWKERGLMALGITLTYLAFKKLLQTLDQRGYLRLSARQQKLTA